MAQGRVWTGRQALQRGLSDHMGGLWRALEIAVNMTESGAVAPKRKSRVPQPLLVETIKAPRKPPSIPFVSALSGRSSSSSSGSSARDALAVIDDAVLGTDLVSPESLGVNPVAARLGLGSPLLSSMLAASGLSSQVDALVAAASAAAATSAAGSGVVDRRQSMLWLLEDLIDELLP